VLDRHPFLIGWSPIRNELINVINRYKVILAKREEKLPSDFILEDVVKRDDLIKTAAERK
jgi:hypothetical protein